MNHGAVEDDDEATVTSDSPPRHRSQKGSGDITNLNARYRTNVSYGDEYSSLRFDLILEMGAWHNLSSACRVSITL